jgi:hypothetical protein
MQPGASADLGAWEDLVETFASSGLPTPPVPRPLRSELRSPEPWCWTTRDIDPFRMYMFDEAFAEDILANRVPDYAAVSHAGHGVNSYAINYHLVHGQLAILMQTGWGGVYTDNGEAAERLARLWGRVDAMLQRTPPAVEDRLLVIYSGLRGVSACGWIRQNQSPDVRRFFNECHTDDASAFDLAELLLSAGRRTI